MKRKIVLCSMLLLALFALVDAALPAELEVVPLQPQRTFIGCESRQDVDRLLQAVHEQDIVTIKRLRDDGRCATRHGQVTPTRQFWDGTQMVLLVAEEGPHYVWTHPYLYVVMEGGGE